MAITQLNTADYDYAMMLNVINKSYKGKADITLSAYDTDSAPDVKVGSVWEDNGAIFILESADLTPTGYAGITNSTTFYLYFDESASVFIYSNTIPVWNDALQGHYNANDRAFFSMYKDSGGTLYQLKAELSSKSENQLDDVTIQNNLTVVDYAIYASKRITSDNYLHGDGVTYNTIFDKLAPFIPVVGNHMLISGSWGLTNLNVISRAERTASNTLRLYYVVATGTTASALITDGGGSTLNISISW